MRRSRLEVIFTFLEALEIEPQKTTKLMHKTNLPYDLFTKYLQELIKAKLIEEMAAGGAKKYRITSQGTSYLVEYRRFLRFSSTFGL